mgnify:CR=1 FL=1
MRAIALAAIIGGTMLAGAAAAETWTDPAGRLIFDKPRGWQVDPQQTSSGTVVLAFDGSHDCFLMATPNSGTSSASARQVVSSTTQPFARAAWETTANSITTLFPAGGAQMTNQSVDSSGVWPIQRAEFQSSEGNTVYAAIQGRPGIDLIGFCTAYSGSADVFNGVFRSMAHPNDASWASSLQAAPAEAAPAPAQ